MLPYCTILLLWVVTPTNHFKATAQAHYLMMMPTLKWFPCQNFPLFSLICTKLRWGNLFHFFLGFFPRFIFWKFSLWLGRSSWTRGNRFIRRSCTIDHEWKRANILALILLARWPLFECSFQNFALFFDL